MNFEDLPVGTVLRDPRTRRIYLRIEQESPDSPWQWREIWPDGSSTSLATAHLPAGLVELVEKPAAPEMAKLQDRCGAPWILRDGLYHTPTCRDDCSKGVTLEHLDSRWGPLTEETGS